MKITDQVFSQHHSSGQLESSVLAQKERLYKKVFATGLPNRKDEAWKYTNLGGLGKAEFAAATASEKIYDLSSLPAYFGARLVFENGFLREDLSQSNFAGLELRSMTASDLSDDSVLSSDSGPDYMSGMAYALAEQGWWIEYRGQEKLTLQIVYLMAEGVWSSSHIGGLVGKNSFLNLQEFVVSSGAKSDKSSQEQTKNAAFQNHLGHWQVEEGAKLFVSQNCQVGAGDFFVQNIQIRQKRDSQTQLFTLAEGGAVNRHNLDVHLAGEGAESCLDSLFFSSKDNQIDFRTTLHHESAHCQSRQLCKGLLAENGRGVFNGLVHVYRDAQKTDAGQLNKNLVLSDKAEINTKPQLLVDADDVKAAHGATVGQLEEEEVYYLQSRAIPREKAIAMLTQGFAKEVVFNIEDSEARDWFLGVAEKAADQMISQGVQVGAQSVR